MIYVLLSIGSQSVYMCVCVCVPDHDDTFYENLNCTSYWFCQWSHSRYLITKSCIPKWHSIEWTLNERCLLCSDSNSNNSPLSAVPSWIFSCWEPTAKRRNLRNSFCKTQLLWPMSSVEEMIQDQMHTVCFLCASDNFSTWIWYTFVFTPLQPFFPHNFWF